MARAMLPLPSPRFEKTGKRRLAEVAERTKEKDTRGVGERRGETYAVASRAGRPRILHCVFFRDKWFTVFPLILPRATTTPAKTRKGLRESPWVGDGGEGMASRKRNGRNGREGEEWSGKASRTIWEVLHIYGLLVRARKQISSKSW